MKRKIASIFAMMAVTSAVLITAQERQKSVSFRELLDRYLKLKDALFRDNSEEAADMGKALEIAFTGFDKSHLTADQKKIFEETLQDALVNARHIAENRGNIKHQREHFEWLSNEMYDLVKKFGSGMVLYRDFCPMYNEGRGGYWLSQVKEIQNPFYGKSMPSCGVIKEELK